MMTTLPSSKLKFEEAYPNDWDVFNAWHAGPVAVTREEAARGLRRARRSGLVFTGRVSAFPEHLSLSVH